LKHPLLATARKKKAKMHIVPAKNALLSGIDNKFSAPHISTATEPKPCSHS
jgi:hypothetical protein